jgi:chemotaxis protein histidine kinase CheA
MKISDIDVIEASIVGVPENQRSWAKSAALAVKSFGYAPETEEETPVADTKTPVEATGTELPDDAGAEPATTETGTDAAPEAAAATPDVQESAEESATDETAVETPAGETPETASDESTSESADPPTVEKAYSVEDVRELVGHVKTLVTEIGRLREENAELVAKQASFVAEAGALTTEVDEAKQVITKVLGMPLRPRTAGYVEDFANRHSLFAPEIAEYLDKRSKLSNGN